MTTETAPSRRALISVSDKTGVAEFAAGLVELGFQIVSTGGTARHLGEAGVETIDIADVTGFPEMMDGRVKTLHPKVHGGLLGRLDQDAVVMAEHGIAPIELVCVNLYPFEQTVAKADTLLEDAIEQIDIGGPSMLRSAAKNSERVVVVTDPQQYESVLGGLRDGTLDRAGRLRLATAVFEKTADYDRAIADYLARQSSSDQGDDSGERSDHSPSLELRFDLRSTLRYGENPHQWAAFYTEPSPAATTLAAARQRNGKELSYNNLLDCDAALQLARDFDDPACCVLKHTNPCGCAVADSLEEAFVNAYSGDPVSAFGSILGFNRPVDVATAERLVEPGRFIEAIVAPGYDDAAFEMLTTVPKWKKNVRLLEIPQFDRPEQSPVVFRSVSGGLLAQDHDDRPPDPASWTVATDRQPTDAERADLIFAWAVVRHVKSNAIVLCGDRTLYGAGAGQMSRLDSAIIAARKAGDRAAGAVLGSDAFFPFRDGVDQAAAAGVTAIVQPGGSKNDAEVVAACDEHDIAMLFTGRRHFRH